MLDKNFRKVFILGLILSSLFTLLSFAKVEAKIPAGCAAPFEIPTACPTSCSNKDDSGCYVPDFDCSNAKLLDPTVSCCKNKCNNEGPIVVLPPPIIETLRSFNIFGTKFTISTTKIPNLINAAISTFLGLVSAYALVRGMYIGAVLRTRATTSEDIVKVNKEIINLIIGFVLAWSFIFIIQFIASVIGIGDLNSLNVTNTGAEITIN
ncbi:MAG: hypothetical protein ABIM99_03485 [Candidatus Dojkabacteria bacterium]